MSLTISDKAAARIHVLMNMEKEGSFLRLSITGGGCSGFQYNFTIDDTTTADDLAFEHNTAKVVIDDISLSLLAGGILDYTEDMVASKFVITNPNASAGCGCGNSFAI